MSSDRYHLAIIGGGIVGLSVAMQAQRRDPRLRIVVLEKEPGLAAHQTGRNSGVIHSGIYYRPGSLKAGMCVRGAAAMVRFCQHHGLPLEQCGKVIVATREAELPALAELKRRAAANGVAGVQEIGRERLRELEPHAAGLCALHVPGTAITDYSAVAHKYAELFTAQGGEIRKASEATGIDSRGGALVIETTAGAVQAHRLINCGGLHADRISRLAGETPSVRIVPFRGEYFEVRPERRHLVRSLIYPVPDPRFPFLGVHFTKRVHGGLEAGPNAVWALKREGYRKSDFRAADVWDSLSYAGFWRMAARYWRTGAAEYWRSLGKKRFARALQELVPEIEEADLAPGGAGVRAQALEPNGNLVDDFRIVHGERTIHVLNVPSPAATASLAIGEYIVNLCASSGGLRP